jgi:hypothetical protein
MGALLSFAAAPLAIVLAKVKCPGIIGERLV